MSDFEAGMENKLIINVFFRIVIELFFVMSSVSVVRVLTNQDVLRLDESEGNQLTNNFALQNLTNY